MKVLTSNIIVASSKEAIDRFFSQGSNAKNLIDEIDQNDDVLLFNNQANPNFISFSHSFGVEGGDQSMTLSFIDPNNEFEKRFIENLSINISNKKRYLYIAYGVGDNLDAWSGPFKMMLFKADFNVDGERKITLKLAPQFKSIRTGGPFGDQLSFDYKGLSNVILGYSKRINIDKTLGINSSKKIYSPLNYDIKEGSQYSIYKSIQENILKFSPEAQKAISEIDFHYLILDAFREYLKAVYNTRNIVLLFPNLNILCANIIRRALLTENIGNPVNNPGVINVIRNVLNELSLDLINLYEERPTSVPINVDQELALEDGVNKGNTKETWNEYYKLSNYVANFSLHNSNNHKDRINRFLGAIVSSDFTQYGLQFYAKTEVNPDTIDYWKGLSQDHILFGGYETFDIDEPVVVLGDWNLIKTFLYNNNSSDPKTEYSKSIPIHPLDRAVLDTTQYKQGLYNFSARSYTTTDPFGTTTTFPDEFGYKEFSKEEKEYITKNNIPLFKYNTTNSNIKKLHLKNEGVYLNNLNLAFAERIERQDTAIVGGKVLKYPKKVTDPAEAISFLLQKGYAYGLDIAEKNKIQKDLISKINPEDAKKLGTTAEKMAKSSMVFLEKLETEKNKEYIILKQFTPGSSFSIFTTFLSQLYKQSRQLSITTLPLFQVTKGSLLQQPCVVLAQDTPVFGSDINTRGLLNTFYSGIYSIVGFNHTITASNAESKFYLVKQISDADLPEIEEPTTTKITPTGPALLPVSTDFLS
jgi:hypothetical protein